jgi:hypothetical protein
MSGYHRFKMKQDIFGVPLSWWLKSYHLEKFMRIETAWQNGNSTLCMGCKSTGSSIGWLRE